MKAKAARMETAAEITRVGFAPIVRMDAERREIELCATSEALDTYGTVFSYDASRDAFERWAGNVREMHERKAVGRRVAVRCDDAQRKVYVRVRISKGAEDTWEKIKDGTLTGASIGASNVQWQPERRAGQEVPVAQRYDLVELSLVDLPSNPDARGVTFVRDGVPLPDLLDELDELDAPSEGIPTSGTRLAPPTLWGHMLAEVDAYRAAAPAADALPAAPPAAGVTAPPQALPARAARLAALGAPAYVERAPADSAPGACSEPEGSTGGHAANRRSTPTESSAWPPDTALTGEPMRGPRADDPDASAVAGDPARETERPAAVTREQAPGGNQEAAFHTAARGILQGCGCPACLAALGALAAGDEAASVSDAGGRVAAAQLARVLQAHTSRLDAAIREVHAGVRQVAATLGQIERRVAAIEAQPMPGGPHLRVAEKTHALLPQSGRPDAGEQMRALEALAGRLSDPQAQIAVATEMIRLQQEAAGLPAAMQTMPRAGGQERGGWHGR